MDIKVIDSKLYFIAPIVIDAWDVFSSNLNPGIWNNKERYRAYSIKPLLANFLGEAINTDFPIAPGLLLKGEIQKSGDPFLSSLNHPLTFSDKKDSLIIGNYSLDSVVKLYVAPNHRCALLLLKVHSSLNTLNDVVKAVYALHKIDHQQAPFLCVNGVPVHKTIKDIIISLFPFGGYSFDNQARLITSTYARVDASSNLFSADDLNASLIRLSLSKDDHYKISTAETDRVYQVFDNTLTCSSREGFATIVLSKDAENEINFIRQFDDTFEKSYLPLYLATLMVDHIYLSALQNLDEAAKSVEQQDVIREAKLVITMSPSPYDHLNKLMEHLVGGWNFDEKYSIISESITSRKDQLEYQRLQIERENKKQQEKRDRTISLLLGFIGVGQVVFAILQLIGANSILGTDVANSVGLKYSSIAMLVVFIALIVFLIIRLCKKDQVH